MSAIEVVEPQFDNVVVLPTQQPSESEVRLGAFMEDAADVVTASRFAGAVIINRYVEQTPDYQSWGLAAGFLGVAATDLVDGYLGKTGRAKQGKDESIRRPLKAYPDHLADKSLVDGVGAAIANRERKNGNVWYASAIAASVGVFVVRDVLTTADRIVADVQDIDTRADENGKRKTVRQILAMTFALTPLTKNPVGKAVAAAGLAYSAKESATSGIKMHRKFSEQRALKREHGELPLQRLRAKREAEKSQRAHWRTVFEDHSARKGQNGSPRVLRQK